MKQTATPNQLIKFLYNETGVLEKLAISDALHADPVLRREFEVLQQAQQQLPKVSFRPSASAIRRILKYSECTAVGREA